MINLTTTLSGEYNIVIKRGDGTTEETGWFHNLILNSGLDTMAAIDPNGYNANLVSRCCVGTGTSTPTVTQTGLDAQIAQVDGGQNFAAYQVLNAGAPTYTTTLYYGWGFGQGTVIGNIAEIGVGRPSGSLFSRALILDNSGNPTTITVTAIDQLTIYYRLNMSPPLADGTGTFTIGSTTYNFTTRVWNATQVYASTYFLANSNSFAAPAFTAVMGAPSTLVAIDSNQYPTGSYLSPLPPWQDQVRVTYIPGTYYQDWQLNISAGYSNSANGIGAMVIGASNHTTQILFNPPIPKTNTSSFSLTTRFSWNRA